MKIACLGWGSLVWKAGDDLQKKMKDALSSDRPGMKDGWSNDGPWLPIEFCRQSINGRVTLVLVPDVPDKKPVRTVRSYWTVLSVVNLSEAIKTLALREGTIEKRIGSLQLKKMTNPVISTLRYETGALLKRSTLLSGQIFIQDLMV